MLRMHKARNDSNWSLFGGFLVDIVKNLAASFGRVLIHVFAGGIAGAALGAITAMVYALPFGIAMIVGGAVGMILVIAVYALFHSTW